jgi:hypothetical protein
MPCAGQVTCCRLQRCRLHLACFARAACCRLYAALHAARCAFRIALCALHVACFTVLLHASFVVQVACRPLHLVDRLARRGAVLFAACCCFVFWGCTFFACCSVRVAWCALHVACCARLLHVAAVELHGTCNGSHVACTVVACFAGVLHVARLVGCVWLLQVAIIAARCATAASRDARCTLHLSHCALHGVLGVCCSGRADGRHRTRTRPPAHPDRW